MDEGARAVRAGHDAVAAADAGVLVDQHDAVVALERGAGRAHVHARRVLAVLAHERQRLRVAGALVAQAHLADPLRIGRGRPWPVDAVLLVAGGDARVAIRALRDVDQQPPALQLGGGLLRRARLRELDQPEARRERTRPRRRRRPNPETGGGPDSWRWPAARFCRSGVWHSKQSMLTAA